VALAATSTARTVAKNTGPLQDRAAKRLGTLQRALFLTVINGTDSNPNTVEQQTDIQRDDWYDPTKPLTREHYDAKQRAAQKH